jgi:hypothetical protein
MKAKFSLKSKSTFFTHPCLHEEDNCRLFLLHQAAEFLNCLGPPAAPAVCTKQIHGVRQGLPLAAAADPELGFSPHFCFFKVSNMLSDRTPDPLLIWFTRELTKPTETITLETFSGIFKSGV